MASYTSAYPPEYSNTYVSATGGAQFGHEIYYATDPSKPLTGSWTGNSAGLIRGEARFHIDLGSAKIIRRIYLENGNYGYIGIGVKNFTFWGSNSATAFAELTYGTDTNWTQLTTDISIWNDHTSTNQSEPQYAVVTNTVAYRYYAMKLPDQYDTGYSWKVIRRIELQTEDGYGAVTFVPKIIII